MLLLSSSSIILTDDQGNIHSDSATLVRTAVIVIEDVAHVRVSAIIHEQAAHLHLPVRKAKAKLSSEVNSLAYSRTSATVAPEQIAIASFCKGQVSNGDGREIMGFQACLEALPGSVKRETLNGHLPPFCGLAYLTYALSSTTAVAI